MYYPKNQVDIETLPTKLQKGNKEKKRSITELINVCGSTFWIPVKQNGTKHGITGEYIWYQDNADNTNEAEYLPWLFGQPNGGIKKYIIILETNVNVN